MYLKTDSLGRSEIVDGTPDDARNDPDAKTARKNPVVDLYVARMREGDPNAQAGFAHFAKTYRQTLVTRAKAGDSAAQKEIATLDRSLPIASKIDTSLLGLDNSARQQQVDAIDYAISILIDERKSAVEPNKSAKINAIDYTSSLLRGKRMKILSQT